MHALPRSHFVRYLCLSFSAVMGLRYRFTFIDEAPVLAVPRSHSCPARQKDPGPEEQALSWQVACLPDRAQRIREPAPAPTPAPSTGSVGHPQVCRRPCVYWARGACRLGSACGYCHMPHYRRDNLDKINRRVVHAMCEAELLAVIIPHLRRMTDGTELHQAKSLVDLLQRELALRRVCRASSVEDLKRLEKTLRRMSVPCLIGLITSRRWKGPLPQVLQEAMTSLREEFALAQHSATQ
ncbi:unnamed protein product [Effrenium voratum]|uniref:C3H1-type domain-containing protein n=1 Tax=Effrenium voratum TaxID=2562239 RepID=A0AA36NGL8_9DINO|nr:unnamed protein product [Effrenium voratum]CAJ1432122.1 unnamed protein product [Effrenium voratum]